MLATSFPLHHVFLTPRCYSCAVLGTCWGVFHCSPRFLPFDSNFSFVCRSVCVCVSLPCPPLADAVALVFLSFFFPFTPINQMFSSCVSLLLHSFQFFFVYFGAIYSGCLSLYSLSSSFNVSVCAHFAGAADVVADSCCFLSFFSFFLWYDALTLLPPHVPFVFFSASRLSFRVA